MVFNRELDFEQALIDKLTSDCGWSPVILRNKTEKELIQNWADILYRNNRSQDRLGDWPLTESEMAQIIEQVNYLRTPVKLNAFINGKTVSIKRDNPDDKEHFGREISLKIYDRLEIAGGNSCYQIVEQPKFPTANPLASDRRGDFTLLINGMPFIHVELKKSGIPVVQACEQIKKYSHEGIFSQGLYSLVQVFVAMSPEETVYFANPGQDGKFRKEFYFHWADFDNNPINDWKEIANTLLSIPMAHELIGFYTVADNSDNTLKVMRSYQYYAACEIKNQAAQAKWDCLDNRGGYIYHTTGSGKTMTSFKAAQIIAECGYADKVVFLMDRIELGTQSLNAYRNFAGNLIDVQSTEDTDILVAKLKSDNQNDALIVTSHQKMSRVKDEFENREKDIEKINSKRLVFILDEAHRDVFGDMFYSIKETFPNALRFGFTGTPIMKENLKKGNDTAAVFGRELHRYSIADGIRDKNVLGFYPVQALVYQEKDLRKAVALKKADAQTEEEAIKDPAKRRIYYKFMREVPMAGYKDGNGNYHYGIEDFLPKSQYENEDYYRCVVTDIKKGWMSLSADSMFHALFATSSIPEAITYYGLFREIFPELKVTTLYDPSIDNNGNGIFKEESTIAVLKDYNERYNKNFGMASDKSRNQKSYAEYKKDVTSRLAHKDSYCGIENDKSKQIDMVIVVDQLLTGFDSKWINTLYMDKIQENENIIQSFSRTNRLYNFQDKPFGTIKYYRFPFSMKRNVEQAIKLYSGDKPFGIFVEQLERQLLGMNQTFREIKHIFEESGVRDFSELPEEPIERKKFAQQFNQFSAYLASAKIQDFKWTQKEYRVESLYQINDSFYTDIAKQSVADSGSCKCHTVCVELNEETYLKLLQRYKELTRGNDGGTVSDSPIPIDPDITEIDTGLIDTEYMNSRFEKFYTLKNSGAEKQILDNVLAELHRSFALLSQEEQRFAKMVLTDIQNGKLETQPDKTFRDYITDYQAKNTDDRISRCAECFDLDLSLLRKMVSNYSDFNGVDLGLFEKLMDGLNKTKAKAFFEERENKEIPLRMVRIYAENLIKKFIEHGGFEL